MTIELTIDQRAKLLVKLLGRFLELPTSQRKSDLTAALKEYGDEWMRDYQLHVHPVMLHDGSMLETHSDVFDRLQGITDELASFHESDEEGREAA